MQLVAPSAPDQHWLASARYGAVEIRFVGRGPAVDRREVLAAAGGAGNELSWLRQIHSDRTRNAEHGECGRGDGLVTDRVGLALSVVTADCVPVVLTDGSRLAVVHAGWRGIAASIVTKSLELLEPTNTPTAWLGPAIGPCCYEVGPDVAQRIADASHESARIERPEGKPHLDLHRAIVAQLRGRGVTEIHRVDTCTRCHPEALASYRRDGAGAGRNMTFAWRVDRGGS